MSSNIIGPSQNISVAPSEKVAPSEEVEKGSGNLDNIEEPVVTICQKYLDNKTENKNIKKYQFQEKSVRSTHCFDIDHEYLEEKVWASEPDFYENSI